MVEYSGIDLSFILTLHTVVITQSLVGSPSSKLALFQGFCSDMIPQLHAKIISIHTASNDSCGVQIENKATQLF